MLGGSSQSRACQSSARCHQGVVVPWEPTCAAQGDGMSTAHVLLYQPLLLPSAAVTHLWCDYLHAWKHFLKFYPLISAPLVWAALVQLILANVHEFSLPNSV